MKQCITIAMLVFSALSTAIGQNADAVKSYLGAYRYDNVAPPAGPVEFVFSRTTLNRQADGKATYKALLKTGYFQDSGNYGSLSGVRITEGGKLVPVERYTPAVDPSGTLTRASIADPVRPRGDGSAIAINSLPDSLEMSKYADNAISTFEQWKASAWTVVKPVWRVVMYVFSSVLTFLFFLGAFLRYIAKTASKESAVNLHGIPVVGGWIVSAQQSAAGALLLICWIVTGVIMLNIFMWIVWLNWSLWLLLAAWFPVQWLAEKLTNGLVPNIHVIPTRGNPTNAARLNG